MRTSTSSVVPRLSASRLRRRFRTFHWRSIATPVTTLHSAASSSLTRNLNSAWMVTSCFLSTKRLRPTARRFWPADSYAPGRAQPSFDKQFVRDYLETLDWDKTAPGPVLPDGVVRKTTEKYLEALTRLTA